MRKKLQALLLTLLIALPSVSLLTIAPSRVIAQESRVASQDTETSIFDVVQYDIVEAERPSDRIVIDESTLYSDNYVDLSEYYYEIVQDFNPPYEFMPKDNFRDLTTYIWYYIFYDTSQELEMLAPINISTDLLDIFELDNLLAALYTDITFKNQHGFLYNVTDDLIEAYHLRDDYFVPAMMADVKAIMLKAEDLMASADPSDYSYDSSLQYYEDIQYEYEVFERRYNNMLTEDDPVIEMGLTEDATDGEIAQANLAMIEEYLQPIPDNLKRRLHYIGIASAYEMPTAWNYEDIHGFANHNLEMYFIDSDEVSPGLLFHELGHVIDFSAMIYPDALREDYNLLSLSPEWEEVFEAEWNEPDSYYAQAGEAFAQGFGAYALMYYHDLSMDDVRYVGSGLEGRPLTEAYFEELFQELAL